MNASADNSKCVLFFIFATGHRLMLHVRAIMAIQQKREREKERGVERIANMHLFRFLLAVMQTVAILYSKFSSICGLLSMLHRCTTIKIKKAIRQQQQEQ